MGRHWWKVFALTAAYALCGWASLALLVTPPDRAAPVWPAAGVAVAALIVWGYRVWPGVFLGATLLNIGTTWDPAHLWVSLITITIMSSGAAAQAVVGAALVRQFVGISPRLDETRSILRFVLFSGPVACLTSPTIVITALVLAGKIPPDACLLSWWHWWVGDAIGVCLLAPPLLLAYTEPPATKLRRLLALLLPVAPTCALVVGLFVISTQHAREQQRHEFEDHAREVSRTIHRHFAAQLEITHSLASFFAGSEFVSRDKFATFVRPTLDRHEGVQALEWIPRIPSTQRATFEKSLADLQTGRNQITQKGPDDKLIPATKRDEYFPVQYVEPYQGNEAALGFDLASNPTRRAALQRARDTGKPATTGRIDLVQDETTAYGFLVFHPVYSRDFPLDTVEQRRHALAGFTLGVYRFKDEMAVALANTQSYNMRVQLVDIDANASKAMLYDSHQHIDGAPNGSSSPIRWASDIDLPGQNWQLNYTPMPGSIGRAWWPTIILTGGLALTCVLSAFLLVITGQTVMIQRVVNRRTAELTATNQAFSQLNQELQASEARTEAILNAALDPIISIDEHGVILSANPAAEQTFGYTRAEMTGQNIKMLMPSPMAEEDDAHPQRYLDTDENHVPGISREEVALRKDGSTFPIELRVNEARPEEQQIFTVIVRDITDRKEWEASLKSVNQELKTQNDEMERFVYTVSHDLKSPIVTILGYLGYMREDLEAGDRDQVRDAAERIERASHRMRQTIDDLLEISRISRDINEPQVVSMDQTIEATLLDLSEQIKKRGATVTSQPHLPDIQFDATRLRQVVENLLVNALKYGCDGPNPQIDIGGFVENDRTRFYIRDHGPGVPLEFQDKIFGLFQRIDTSKEGTGIGLAIVKRSMETHGGAVWVESPITTPSIGNAGHGTAIWLEFPGVVSKPKIATSNSNIS